MCVFGGCDNYLGTHYSNNPESMRALKPEEIPGYNEWLYHAARNSIKDTRSLAEKKGWLTQAMIDKYEPEKVTPKGCLYETLKLICFAVAAAVFVIAMRAF